MFDLENPFPGKEPNLSDSISYAQRQILTMHLQISNLRVFYWMAMLLVGILSLAATASIAVGAVGMMGGVSALSKDSIATCLWAGILGLPIVLLFGCQRIGVLGVLITQLRQQRLRLETALDKARVEAAEADKIETVVLAVVWTGDAQIAIASATTRKGARKALMAGHPSLSVKQLEQIDYVETKTDQHGLWAATVDGN